MSKVITFSRTFPSYHPRKGEETFFVQKIWNNILDGDKTSYYEVCTLNESMEESSKTILWGFWASIKAADELKESKGHTIRAGHRFKVGDKFSPRVWSGKPYASKQIIIAPDIEVKKVWGYKVEVSKGIEQWYLDGTMVSESNEYMQQWFNCGLIEDISKNDGLELVDFLNWFKHPKYFDGQIICWDASINY